MSKYRNTRVVNINTTLTSTDENVVVNVTSTPIIITLPLIGGDIRVNDVIKIIHGFGDISVNNITIIPNSGDGSTIIGGNIILNKPNSSVFLELTDNGNWLITSSSDFINTYSISGASDTNIGIVNNGDYLMYNGSDWVDVSENEIYLVVSADSQTYFTNLLPTEPLFPTKTECWVNGQKQIYGVLDDFVLSGTTNQDFVWLNNYFELNISDEISLMYK